jgi:hypothetical protein
MIINLIQPKEIDIDGKVYKISKFPAMDGIEIATKFSMEALKRIDDYEMFKGMVSKIMSFVEAKQSNGNFVRLISEEAINNNLNTEYATETLFKLIIEMAEYNFSFFPRGSLSILSNAFAQMLPVLNLKTSTALPEQF